MWMILLLAFLVAPPAWAQAPGTSVLPSGEEGPRQLPLGEDGPLAPPPPAMAPSDPATPEQLEQWRRDLVSKPAFSSGGGRVGTVTELSVGVDNRVNAAVITTEGGARLPIPWYRMRSQLGAPTVVVPWSQAEIVWLSRRPSGQ